MDKNKLLNSLRSQRNAWNESLVNTMKEHIKSEASVKILENVIAEVEEDKNPDFLSLNDIVKGMQDYCELVYNECCNKCPFYHYITNFENSCMKDIIKENMNKAKSQEEN